MERNIDKLLSHGNKAQREKLEIYNNKDCWNSQSLERFIEGLVDEMVELKEIVHKIVVSNGLQSIDNLSKELRHEAADVANYAHMIIQRCDEIMEE